MIKWVGLILLFPCIAIFATEDGDQASAEQFKPAGWLDVESSLVGDKFTDYVEDVRQRLVKHRISLDPNRAVQEIDRAAPRQLEPVETCNGDVLGIVILVHGLSDTAFSMYDMARYFAKQCYIARTVLLPGHGTRAGDMLVVNHDDWTDTVRYLTDQASREHEHVLLVGFSLGAVVTLTVAMDVDSEVDAVIAVSPAYHLSMYRYARFASLIHYFYKWIDKDMATDAMRYESMPTRGVAETVHAMQQMHKRIDEHGTFGRPWMLIQSLDDRVTLPEKNQAFVLERSSDPRSRVVNFYTDQKPDDRHDNVQWLKGTSDQYRVNGLTHLAVHIAPNNSHYGQQGDYRHCGGNDGRDATEAQRCTEAPIVRLTDWSKLSPTDGKPTALSSFNPRFPELEASMNKFLAELEPKQHRRKSFGSTSYQLLQLE